MNLSLEDYFKSSFEEKLLIKMPERENDHLTVATRLLDKRREMNEVDQALNAQKEEFQMKMESLSQRKEELEKKEYQLREALMKFDKFLKENDAKKIRALNKVIEEKTIKRAKDEEIKKLNEEILMNIKVKDKLLKRLARYQKFHRYLEEVTEVSEDISEIREIIDRYDTLTCNLNELKMKNREYFESIDKSRKDLATKRKVKDRNVIESNNKLAKFQKQLDELKSQVIKSDDEYTVIKQSLAGNDLIAGKIIIATYNLNKRFNNMEQRMYPDDITVETVEEQLDEISKYISERADVYSLAEKYVQKTEK